MQPRNLYQTIRTRYAAKKLAVDNKNKIYSQETCTWQKELENKKMPSGAHKNKVGYDSMQSTVQV